MDWLFLHLQRWKWIKSRARKINWRLIVGGPGSQSETHRRLEGGRRGWPHEKLSDLQSWAASIEICILWFTNTFSTSGWWKQCAMQRGFRNELDMGMTHGAQSERGEMHSQPATEHWVSCGLRCCEDSETMSHGHGEPKPEHYSD